MIAMGIVITFALFLLGSPIYSALGIGCGILSLFSFGFTPASVADLFTSSLNSFTLLALPLFILVGNLFLISGSSKPLMDFMGSIFGRIPASMGIASVAACAFFAAISASSTATCVTIGLIMIPEMFRLGYNKGFASSIVAASGGLGNLIPPSLFFIIYGTLEEINIATLFAAGMIPGIFVATLLALTVYIVAKVHKVPTIPPVSWRERWNLFLKAIPSLIIPVVILGGIYGGFFTPTEAAAVACGLILILGFLIYRKMTLKNLWDSLAQTAVQIGAIMILVAGGIVLGKMFVVAGFPEAIRDYVIQSNMSSTTFLILAGVVIFILGCFIECVLMIYVCANLFMTSVVHLGINPIHFGVIIVVGALWGMTTPPMAESIYVVSKISGVESYDIIKWIWPYIITYGVAMYIVMMWPQMSLFLPRLLWP